MIKFPIKIIAIGNVLYGDDGIGYSILQDLRKRPSFSGIPLINCGVDALSLIDHFSDTEQVIIIDAVKMGMQPGTIKVFETSDVEFTVLSKLFSLHGINLANVLELAELIGAIPDKITIVGVEPEQLQAGKGLSPAVADARTEIIDNLRSLIFECQHQIRG
ncbi:MAG: hydrogenase maturation protease [FCB group bacterium]|nr:hydrogenase maturation protease [FCB group bacterium]